MTGGGRALRCVKITRMSSKAGRDDQQFVSLFLSAYENGSWRDAKIDWLDQRLEGAVEAKATRRSDGRTLAIEHTLIEPFMEDKSDFALFEQHFLPIRDDETLKVQGHAITVYVPVGTLKGLVQRSRETVADAVHAWIRENRLHLRNGKHEYPCPLAGGGAAVPSEIPLTIKNVEFGISHPGLLSIRRQQVTNDLDKVIAKALQRKLTKLMRTKADKHILFFERDQFTFLPQLIFAELHRQRQDFPLLEQLDELWLLETISYKQEGFVMFERYKGDMVVASLVFEHGELLGSEPPIPPH